MHCSSHTTLANESLEAYIRKSLLALARAQVMVTVRRPMKMDWVHQIVGSNGIFELYNDMRDGDKYEL